MPLPKPNNKNSEVALKVAPLALTLSILIVGLITRQAVCTEVGLIALFTSSLIYILLFTSKILDGKRTIEVCALVLGLIVLLYGIPTEQTIFVAIGFVVAFGPFLIIEILKTDEIRKDFKNQQASIRMRLDRIDQYLKASVPDTLTIAIFDELLIYLPMYVAKAAGFLQQEGIEVKFMPFHGDKKVAEAVKNSDGVIGLCDPCMCALEEFAQPGESLRVLAPLVVQRAVKPVTRHEAKIRSQLVTGGKITIATYPAPSTTYVMAVNLKNELKAKHDVRQIGNLEIKLEEIEASKFNEQNIGNLLDTYEMVMLWDPFLTYAKNMAESSEFELRSPSVDLPELMYSSLIISEKLLEERPTLGIRLFRALSRATYMIHVAANNDKRLNEVVEAVKAHMKVNLHDPELTLLIRRMISADLLFPFVTNPKEAYGGVDWCSQFYHAILCRMEAMAHSDSSNSFKDKVLTIDTPESCRRFFCDEKVFHPIEQFGVSAP